MGKCIYCHKDTYEEYCSESCRIETERFQEHVDRYQTVFIFGLFGSMLFILPIFVFPDHLLMFIGLMVVAMGAVLSAFPFCTPETNRMMGIARGIRLGRGIGIACLAVGALMVVFDLI